jgi:Tfp pilus assembly protein PilP
MRQQVIALVARRIAWAALAASLAVPATSLAQAPKLPQQLPVPRAVPKPEVPEIARPLRPGQPGQAGQTAPPAPPQPTSPASPAGPRDPFTPLVTRAPEGENRPSLSGLRLVGVVWDPVHRDQIRALVETPDGLGYYVRVNEQKFGGTVVGIDRNSVRFTVSDQDPGGQRRTRTVELKLN